MGIEELERDWKAAKSGAEPHVHEEQLGNTKDMNTAIKSAFTQIHERFKRGDKLAGATTGFYDLDKVIDGLKPGTVNIVGARTGAGKSIFAVNVALETAKAGNSVLYLSLEMSTEEQVKRAMFCWSGVESHRLKKCTLTKEDWAALTAAGVELSKLDFIWDDSCGITIEEIEARIERRIGSTTLPPLAVVVIDHILLIRGSNQRQDRRNQVTAITGRLKEIAKKYNIAILALTQLNRAVEARNVKDKRPQISDMQESGSTEQDADVIMLLYRQDYYERDKTKHNRIMEVNAAKVREGAPGVIKLKFDGDRYKLHNLDDYELD